MQQRELKPAAAGDDGTLVDAALSQSPTPARRLVPRRLKLAGGIAAACALVAALALGLLGGGSSDRSAATASATPVRAAALSPEAQAEIGSGPARLKSHPKVVVAVRPGEAAPVDANSLPNTGAAAPQPPSDAEVRQELNQFKQHLAGFSVARGPVPEIRPDGTAIAPLQAPGVIAQVIAAGNAIATTPYKWGGGHGAWKDSGYDCSGSVSFALAGAGLMNSPLTSGGFMSWGDAGPGRWISIYANNGHVWMTVAGLRFDTSGANGFTRWQSMNGRSTGGFVVRHPPGL
ncbi:MAG: peptidoglycan DL-endopeptidase RipB [Thermoleophilaceae bacterium]|nr:peptidoglycan DL-endopeptidase RipB [Thermoleophilaceae bacterium]